MHMTVRNGKSLVRLGYDQGSGGYQSLPTNEDPGRTNAMPPDQDPQPQPDPQRAAELGQGTMDALQRLRESLEGEQLIGWTALRAILPPGTYDALSGVTGPVGRPTAPTMDTPPGFPACRGLGRGKWRRTSGRGAPGLAVRSWRMTLRRLKTCLGRVG